MHHRFKTFSLLLLLGLVLPTQAVTITLTDGDPCSVMGALIDHDSDTLSALLAVEFHGPPSKPNIGTKFPGQSFYPQPRRAIAEFALEPLRDIATDPNQIKEAYLRFYFDDVIFPDNSPHPWTTQRFSLQAYTENANGRLDWSDENDFAPIPESPAPDDWDSPRVDSSFCVSPVVQAA